MSISDQQYLDWLAADSKTRVILCEAVYHNGTTTGTLYTSNHPYVSAPADTPANQAYDDRIPKEGIPQFTRRMSEQFTGRSTQSWGDIVLINDDGDLDAYLGYGWDGRSLKLYYGDPTWPKSDFRLIMSGTTADITVRDQKTITLRGRDKSYALNIPIQTSVIGGSTTNAGKLVPLLYGEAYNIEPVLIDSALHRYQYHDGAAEGVTTVYDNGVSVAFTDTPGSGYFVLLASPAGQITCDAKGAKPSGSYKTKCADIINHIVTTRSGLVAGDLDTSNFTTMNTTAPQTLGIYIKDRANVIEILDQLVTSVGGWWSFTRAGLMQLGVLKATTGTAVLTIAADQIVERGVTVQRRDLPIAQYQLGWKRLWSVQKSGLAGSVTEARMAELAAEYQVTTKTNAGVLTKHLLADKPDVVGTLLVASAEANTEAQRRVDLRNVVRKVFAIESYTAPFQINIGDEVEIEYPRFGLDAGVHGIVVGTVEDPVNNRLKLEVWI